MPDQSFWNDPDFQVKLLALVVRDRAFLKECSSLLDSDDFKPVKRDGPQDIWITASLALDFHKRFRTPIAGNLRIELLDYCRKNRLGEKQKSRLLDLCARLKEERSLVAAEAITEKVIGFKKDVMKAKAVQELLDLSEANELTDEKWLEVCMKGIEQFGGASKVASDYLSTVEDRIARRELNAKLGRTHIPYFLVDPLDELIRGIGRGNLGLILAYLNVGKSAFLRHFTAAFLLQSLNVLYITLEDPVEEVENQFDAAITQLPTNRLNDLPNKLRSRFHRFSKLLRSRLRIYDGTEQAMTVPDIQGVWEAEYNKGFVADVTIIDYDDEIKPSRKQPERRFEFADIYRDLRRFAAKKDQIVWTAATTTRKSEGKKVITSSDAAEDISKARKAALAIGVGPGEWGLNSRYLWVMRHRFDRKSVGCHVIGDYDRGMAYDRQATLNRIAADARKKNEQESDTLEGMEE